MCRWRQASEYEVETATTGPRSTRCKGRDMVHRHEHHKKFWTETCDRAAVNQRTATVTGAEPYSNPRLVVTTALAHPKSVPTNGPSSRRHCRSFQAGVALPAHEVLDYHPTTTSSHKAQNCPRLTVRLSFQRLFHAMGWDDLKEGSKAGFGQGALHSISCHGMA